MISLLSLISSFALANSTGVTGKSTTGCTTCHGSSADSTTSVSFSTDAGSWIVAPGETINLTFRVATSGRRTAAGLNVSAGSGTLAAGRNTRASGGEITHSSATAMSSGATDFVMTWTAPSTEGEVTLYGAGNAVDESRSASGDGWNTTRQTITVLDCDKDDDGYDSDSSSCGGDDCDDTKASVNPGARETWYDGTDQDCDGNDDDQDGDGHRRADDCDDTDASVWDDCGDGGASDGGASDGGTGDGGTGDGGGAGDGGGTGDGGAGDGGTGDGGAGDGGTGDGGTGDGGDEEDDGKGCSSVGGLAGLGGFWAAGLAALGFRSRRRARA